GSPMETSLTDEERYALRASCPGTSEMTVSADFALLPIESVTCTQNVLSYWSGVPTVSRPSAVRSTAGGGCGLKPAGSIREAGMTFPGKGIRRTTVGIPRSSSPDGNWSRPAQAELPASRLQVYGGLPPAAVSCCE